MSKEKYTYDQLIDIFTDTMDDWFENLNEEVEDVPVAIMIMSEAMNNLKERGFCQHGITDMVVGAVDEFIAMEVSYAKDHNTEPFPIICDHDRPSFMDTMKPISKKTIN